MLNAFNKGAVSPRFKASLFTQESPSLLVSNLPVAATVDQPL